MSGETEDSVSGWTTDTLHAHMQQRIADEHDLTAQRVGELRNLLQERYDTQTKALDAAFVAAEKAVAAALASAEKAVAKAEAASERRFEAVNEFRAQLSDQAATFMPRTEAQARSEALAEKIDALATRLDKTEGRGVGLSTGWIYLLGAIAAIGTLVSMYLVLRGGV